MQNRYLADLLDVVYTTQILRLTTAVSTMECVSVSQVEVSWGGSTTKGATPSSSFYQLFYACKKKYILLQILIKLNFYSIAKLEAM